MDQDRSHKAANAARVGTVDTVKGIAIILMVFGHAEQSGFHRNLWISSAPLMHGLVFAENFIYSFHMASFFFIAGLFLASSLEHRGARGFIFEKVRTVLYPYVLWVLLTGFLGPLTARFRVGADPFSWRSLIEGLLTGNTSWFLITLYICQMLALLIFRSPPWAQMAIALGVSYLVPDAGIITLFAPFQYLPFLIVGMWFSAHRMPLLERIQTFWAATAFLILMAVQLATIAELGEVTRWDRFPVGLVGIAMVLFLARALHGTIADRVFRWYGTGSLAIFVLSPFFHGLAREFVMHVLHTTRPMLYLGIMTAVAATVPVVIWYLQKPLHLSILFRWPAPKNRTVPTNTQPVAG